MVLEAIDDGRLSKSQVLTASETAISEVPPDGSNVGIKVTANFHIILSKNMVYW